MIPAWMAEEMKRRDYERRQAEERARIIAEIPSLPPTWQDAESRLRKVEEHVRRTVIIDIY